MEEKEYRVNVGPEDCGCWLDSHRGVYIGEGVIDVAEGFGMDWEEVSSSPEEFLADRDSQAEWHWELVDKVEEWLNENSPPKFLWNFGEGAGDFFLTEVREADCPHCDTQTRNLVWEDCLECGECGRTWEPQKGPLA